MIVELAAVRLLAPWFGTSHVVWTNVIGVILLALAVGYLVGARLASGAAPVRVLGVVLLAVGVIVAWLPWLGAAVARRLVPEELALHDAAPLLAWGSLAVASTVFLPPAALLGTVCPLVVEALARARGYSAGRAGGAVLFASTAGSLAGVFGTSHVLLPEVGLRRTFWLAAALLLVAAIAARVLCRQGIRRWPSTLVGLGLGAASAAFPPERPSMRSNRVELAQRESSYQSLRVVEEHAPDGVLRFLQVNEGFDSFQSVWQPERGLLPVGFYYNDFLLPGAWTAERDPWRVLVLGLGAGSVTRVFTREDWPAARFVGVELDPVVIELGREFFELDAECERLEVWAGMDARLALRVGREPFEQIVLDCYANQVEIPAHLCTLEFFVEARARLAPGGWLTANLGGFDFEDPVVEAVATTCARAFESAVLLVRVPQSRNFVLLARERALLPWDDAELDEPAASSLPALGPRLLPGFAREVRPDAGAATLTDDRCPIEELQIRSIREAQDRRRALGT